MHCELKEDSMLKGHIFKVMALSILVTLVSISPVFAEIVVPPQFENQNDFGANSVFDCTTFPTGTHTQVLFPAVDLIPGTITGFASRLFENSPGFGPVSVPNVTIIFSTNNINALSTTFGANTGLNPVTVFNGTVNFGVVPACGTDPCPFNDPLILQTPFDYNPADGNLIVEIIIPPCIGGVPPNVLADATGVLEGVFAPGPNDLVGIPAFGLITEFIFASPPALVPTLSEWGLIAMAGILGIVGFMVIRRRKATA